MSALQRFLAGLLLVLGRLVYGWEVLFALLYALYAGGAGFGPLGLTLLPLPGAAAGVWLAGRAAEAALRRRQRAAFLFRLARYCAAPPHRLMVAASAGFGAGVAWSFFATPLPWVATWALSTQNTFGNVWLGSPRLSWPTPYALGAGVLLGASWALRRLYERWRLRIPSFAPGN